MEEDVPVIDLTGEMPHSSAYYYDWYHLTNENVEKTAEIISGSLIPYLSKKFFSICKIIMKIKKFLKLSKFLLTISLICNLFFIVIVLSNWHSIRPEIVNKLILFKYSSIDNNSDSMKNIRKIIDSLSLLTEREHIDFIRNFVYENSLNLIDEEHEKYALNTQKVLDMMYNFYKTGNNPPHLSCGPRASIMKAILDNLSIKNRIVHIFCDNFDNIQSHTFLEVFISDENRWEIQDPGYNIFFMDSNSLKRLSAAQLLFGSMKNVIVCSYDKSSGWEKLYDFENVNNNYFEAVMYDNRKENKKSVILVNTNRFSVSKVFEKNGGMNFIQFANKHYGKPVFILNQQLDE